MSEVKHKFSALFFLFVLDVLLAIALVPAIEVETNLGYADSAIGAFVIFIVILVVGSASIGSYDLDKRYHLHERAIKGSRDRIRRAHASIKNRRKNKVR